MPRSLELGNQRGTALLLAITLVLILAAVGAAVSIASRTDILIAASFRQSRDALYAAEGAVAHAVHDLTGIPDWDAVLSGAVASSFTDGIALGVRTLPGGDTVTLCCGLPSLTHEVQQRANGGRSWVDDTPQWQIFAWGPATDWLPGRIDSVTYVVVWVADDPDDGDGNPSADANGIIGLYAQALGPRGGRRVVDVLLRREPATEEGLVPPGLRILSWRHSRW
ncbi:hypothetical protein BH24ACI5_BH24ACI5_09640 [soil metagenome]